VSYRERIVREDDGRPPPEERGFVARLFLFVVRAGAAAGILFAAYYFFFYGFEDALGLISRDKAPTAATQEFDKLQEKLSQNEKFRRHLHRRGAASPAQESFKLAKKGVIKLEDEPLLQKWNLDTKIMAMMTPQLCRKLLRRKIDDKFVDDYLGAINRLPVSDIKQHFDLSHSLISLALDDGRAPRKDHLKADSSFLSRQFTAMFGEDELKRFAAVHRDPDAAADSDICWAVQAIYAKINQLPPLDRLQLIRLLSTDNKVKIRIKTTAKKQ
jgi:hypothetical protein